MAPASASHSTEPPGHIHLPGGYFPMQRHGLEQRLHGSCVGEPQPLSLRAGGQIPQRPGSILLPGGYFSCKAMAWSSASMAPASASHCF